MAAAEEMKSVSGKGSNSYLTLTMVPVTFVFPIIPRLRGMRNKKHCQGGG